MLEEKDFQTIGKLLDEKLEKKFDEMAGIVNSGFTDMQSMVQGEISSLREAVKLRPTLNQIMSWGDKKIVSLELDMDKVKYLHQKEISELPPQKEISQALAEKGLKTKMA